MDTQPVNLNGLALDAVIGIIVSILGGIFTTCGMASWLKQGIVLLISVLLAVGRCLITGDLTPTNLSASIVAVAISAWTSYQTITEKLAKQLQTSVGITDNKKEGS